METDVQPLTPDRWSDVEAIFGARGCSIARGCWCMYYRTSGKEAYEALRLRDARRAALRSLVDAGRPPGLIGYRQGEPVGWVSLGPREEFAKLRRSPVARPVDDRPVWSVVCFVVPAAHRGQGVAQHLLYGAADYARGLGAQLLEGYPVESPTSDRGEWLWMGTRSMFQRAGFVEVARRRANRPVMRLTLE